MGHIGYNAAEASHSPEESAVVEAARQDRPAAPPRAPLVRGSLLVVYAVLLVGLVAASLADRLAVPGEPPTTAQRPTLTWVAVGTTAYLLLIWPIFLFAAGRGGRPFWLAAVEGGCLVLLAVPALLAGGAFSNAPAGRVWLMGAYLASLVVLMTGLVRLAERAPAVGRWVLTAAEVLGLGVPLLVYFFLDFSAAPTGWGWVSPPLAAAAVAGGSLSAAAPPGVLAIIGPALVGLLAWGTAQALRPSS